MKKLLILIVLAILTISMFADDFQKNSFRRIDDKSSVNTGKNVASREEAPVVLFEVDPVDIIVSYYDYMPGSYLCNPMKLQPEISMPYGYQAGGLYLAFHLTPNSGANTTRRDYYAYINSASELVSSTTITTDDIREGYAGIDIDPFTGNPLIAWHNSIDGGTLLDCSMSYDLYSLMGGPGLWNEAFTVINNPDDGEPFTGHNDDEFIWPVVRIGPSPLEGKNRTYIVGHNATPCPTGSYVTNVLFGYADFNSSDMESQIELEFTYHTFPEWDLLQYDNNPDNDTRVTHSLAISDDGQVAFVGFYDKFEENVTLGRTTWCMQYSQDYGETWTYYETDATYEVNNPLDEAGDPYFENEDGSVAEMFASPDGNGGHYNALFTNSLGSENAKITCMGAFTTNTVENDTLNYWIPKTFNPKIFNFEIVNGELEVDFVDLYIEGVNPNDDVPSIQWDLDEDGYGDNFDDEGLLDFPASVPSWSWFGDANNYFHETNFKVSFNNNWGVAVWQDAEGVYLNYEGYPGYEDWAEKPQIAVAVSGDYGVTWSQPAFLNANSNDENYFTELDGMIPAYVYTTDQLEVIDEYHAKLHLFFMDDYSYGSFIQDHGANEGGMLSYAALNVEMPAPYEGSANNNELVNAPDAKLLQNYPNPFNPETTIGFDMKESGNVSIEIFNMKGQKVKTLVNREFSTGYNSETWNGKDDNNKSVSSGVYFYKLKTSRYTATKKMILMK